LNSYFFRLHRKTGNGCLWSIRFCHPYIFFHIGVCWYLCCSFSASSGVYDISFGGWVFRVWLFVVIWNCCFAGICVYSFFSSEFETSFSGWGFIDQAYNGLGYHDIMACRWVSFLLFNFSELDHQTWLELWIVALQRCLDYFHLVSCISLRLLWASLGPCYQRLPSVFNS